MEMGMAVAKRIGDGCNSNGMVMGWPSNCGHKVFPVLLIWIEGMVIVLEMVEMVMVIVMVAMVIVMVKIVFLA